MTSGIEQPQTAAPSENGSRALSPGSRLQYRVGVVLLVAAAAAVVLVLISRGQTSSGAKGSALPTAAGKAPAARRAGKPAAHGAYGGIPSWLPKPKTRVGRTVHASAGHPWLAIEGDSIAVRLEHGNVTVTAVGPAVPEEGQFPVPATTPCTFTITLTKASGTIPLSSAAFTIIDEYGHIHHPRVTLAGGGAPPERMPTGRALTLTVKDVLPTGNGRLRWAPNTQRPMVSWDFDVEID